MTRTTKYHLHVTRNVPSQTIHIPTEAYQYILETEKGSVSARAAELIEKGIEVEDGD